MTKETTLTVEYFNNTINNLTRSIDTAFKNFESKIDARFNQVDRQLLDLSSNVLSITSRVGTLESLMLEVKDDIEARNVASDKDSETIIQHEEKITALELRLV